MGLLFTSVNNTVSFRPVSGDRKDEQIILYGDGKFLMTELLEISLNSVQMFKM